VVTLAVGDTVGAMVTGGDVGVDVMPTEGGAVGVPVMRMGVGEAVGVPVLAGMGGRVGDEVVGTEGA